MREMKPKCCRCGEEPTIISVGGVGAIQCDKCGYGVTYVDASHIKREAIMEWNMMNRLIELIQEAVDGCDTYWAARIAHHLTKNGVPVQEWTPVSEPPEEGETVWLYCKNGAVFSGYRTTDYDGEMRFRIHTALSSTKLLNKGRVTHWMPLPESPKGE